MRTNPAIADLTGEVKQVPIRNGYGEGLLIAGEKNKNVVVLCADLSESTRSLGFQLKYPERFVEVGVAEQNMASLASGFAMAGKVPFISSYAMFSPGRNWEQIRTTICYNNTNVKVAGAHAGVSVGPDGATHQAIEDVNIMRAIPNMTIIVPTDAIEARKATVAAAEFIGPVYLRFAREKTPIVTTDATPFQIGKAEVFVEGDDVLIVAMGTMVYEALMAAKELEKEGVSAAVINCHTVKPLDTKTILDWARRCGCIVTAEEHQITGGLGSAVAEIVSQEHPVPVQRIGVQNRFGQSGPPEELLKLYGLKASNIAQAARDSIRLKFAHAAQLTHKVTVSPRGPTAKSAAQRVLGAVPQDVTFKVRNGMVIRSIPELHKAVLAMDQATFQYHVNDQRNDFAQWIEDVQQDHELAHVLKNARTKAAVVRLLGTRIGQLHQVKR
ncbi:MAG TPA: transketolase family protein [Candidatus Binatia bacterium]|nr:transketolase family protein [Candidatus Binatia bacterium]